MKMGSRYCYGIEPDYSLAIVESFSLFLLNESLSISEAIMRYVFFHLLACIFFSCTFLSCKQDITGLHPESYVLNQNWPNPFRDTTHISYGVPSVGNNPGPHIRVVIYDRFENLEKTLVDQVNHSASMDTIIWNGRNANYEKASAGIYYIELQTIDNGNTTVQVRIAALKQ
jgi:hypothetical protein